MPNEDGMELLELRERRNSRRLKELLEEGSIELHFLKWWEIGVERTWKLGEGKGRQRLEMGHESQVLLGTELSLWVPALGSLWARTVEAESLWVTAGLSPMEACDPEFSSFC